MKKIYSLLAAVIFCGGAAMAETSKSDFEDINLGDKLYDNGETAEGKFTSGDFNFVNNYSLTEYGPYFDGFTISASTSTAFDSDSYLVDQFNSCVGSGAGNSSQYAVISWSSYSDNRADAIYHKDNKLFTPQSVALTNAAYAFNVIRTGNNYSRKFTDEDVFTLKFLGYKENEATGTSVEVNLAEAGMLQFAWKTIDLTDLGEVDEIRFEMTSTDSGNWGMNTPAFFCIDDFVAEVSSVTSAKAVQAETTQAKAVALFSADGKEQSELQNGVNIIMLSDGTIRKVYK